MTIKQINFIKHKMLDADVSIKELSFLTGIDYKSLMSKMEGARMFKFDDIVSIANVLQFTNEEIIKVFYGR